jgi:hypothetical protein
VRRTNSSSGFVPQKTRWIDPKETELFKGVPLPYGRWPCQKERFERTPEIGNFFPALTNFSHDWILNEKDGKI